MPLSKLHEQLWNILKEYPHQNVSLLCVEFGLPNSKSLYSWIQRHHSGELTLLRQGEGHAVFTDYVDKYYMIVDEPATAQDLGALYVKKFRSKMEMLLFFRSLNPRKHFTEASPAKRSLQPVS